MSSQVLASSQKNDKTQNIIRPTTKFHPPIWGDRFLHYNISEQELEYKEGQVEELKEVVRKEIFHGNNKRNIINVSKQLKLIDDVERLGLSYHFESEIEKKLQHIYEITTNNIDHQDQHYYYSNHDEDLHDVSIRFRLLRQHGFNISSNIFEKFKDESGKFKESLKSDIEGMLSLYEASYLSYVEENILDEALAFTTTNLKLVANKKEHPLSHEISLALYRPLRKTLVRLYARHYISIYEKQPSHNKVLLQFAKLDFNLLQSLHKKELSEISRWWKELDLANKLPFARNRIVELYLWILGVFHEPQFSLARKILIKAISMASVADDIYDAYGTFEELELLTEAILRWDISFIDKLSPDYLKTYYKVFLNSYEECEKDLKKEERYKLHYAKESMKKLIQAYFHEAQWLNQGHFPSFDEHLKVSFVSSGYPMLIETSFVGMQDVKTNQVFEWLSTQPKIFRACTIISRFMDDLVSRKFEQERNHVPSTVDCYMKQYGVSEQEACDELNKQVVNLWKEINQEFLRPTSMPSSILVRILNFTKVLDIIYKEGDGYTHVGKLVKDSVAALLIDPIPL
ncbi:hypothetical protein CsatB_018641 [Cannabis sativa]|uniref:Germacrene B synthase TPS16CC n=1 Tax=Cannabis sativa TaxID=3483 RepID=T16CC_CANSA|nr:hypothetical protein G4B88_025726 [Cannabis sativa]QCQ18307.1 germacrene B synthase [Cannabis sativa]